MSTTLIITSKPDETNASHQTRSGGSFLSWLPRELRCRIVSFLHPTEAQRFSTQLGAEYGVIVSRLERAPRIVTRASWNGDPAHGDEPVCSQLRLPVLRGGPVHSAIVSFRWRDQGWGNQKGKLYIVASQKDTTTAAPGVASDREHANNNSSSLPFDGGRVVCETDLAPRTTTTEQMVFAPRDESEIYTLWYKCGGGGGHELHVEDCTIRLYVFDDPEHHWANNYQRLYDLGAVGFPIQQSGGPPLPIFAFGRPVADDAGEHLPRPPSDNFFPKMLLRVCKSLRRQLKNASNENPRLDLELVEFMNEHNIPVSDISLRAVEEIVKADMEERNAFEKAQRAALEEERRGHARERERNAGGPRFQFAPFAAGQVQGGVAVIGGEIPPEMARRLFGHDGVANNPAMDDIFNQMNDVLGEHVIHQMNEMFGDFEDGQEEVEDDEDDEDDDEMPNLIDPADLRMEEDEEDDIDDGGAIVVD